MKKTQTAHLVYGPTASGKSTFARKLAGEQNAVRFAIDEWMHTLFASDVSPSMDMSWAMARVARCQAQMWATAEQTLGAGVDVVMEFGLFRQLDRDRVRGLVEAAGHRASLCFIDAELGARRARVLQRNKEKGGTFSFEVSPLMFEAMETVFERPDHEEQSRSVVIRSGDQNA